MQNKILDSIEEVLVAYFAITTLVNAGFRTDSSRQRQILHSDRQSMNRSQKNSR